MSKLRGRLVRADIGTGAWVLDGDDGTRWQLQGDIPRRLSGKRVVVDGKRADTFGFAMTGPVLEVRRIEAED